MSLDKLTYILLIYTHGYVHVQFHNIVDLYFAVQHIEVPARRNYESEKGILSFLEPNTTMPFRSVRSRHGYNAPVDVTNQLLYGEQHHTF